MSVSHDELQKLKPEGDWRVASDNCYLKKIYYSFRLIHPIACLTGAEPLHSGKELSLKLQGGIDIIIHTLSLSFRTLKW